MGYVIRAIIREQGGGFTSECSTKRAAVESAKALRAQGMLVTIYGPDGKPVKDD
jgi:hypothetical protein